MGRWKKLNEYPRILCDTGHNIGGISYIVQQLSQERYANLHIVIGMVDDKDINGVLALLPKEAKYYFTKASVKRALNENELATLASKHQLIGDTFSNVEQAVKEEVKKRLPEDLIFVGGSTLIVADLLANCYTFSFH